MTVGSDGNRCQIKRAFPSKQTALDAAHAKWQQIQHSGHTFSATLATGRPELMVESPVVLQGYKQEIDAINWVGVEVRHRLDSGELITQLQLEQVLSDAVKPTYTPTNPASSLDMLVDFLANTGKNVTLSQLGLDKIIADLVKQKGALGKPFNRSVHTDFQQQVAEAQLREHLRFKRSYDFRILRPGPYSASNRNPNYEPRIENIFKALWSIGHATVGGQFTLDYFFVDNNAGIYQAIGSVNYYFYDKYTDTIDIGNDFEGEFNFGLPPYDITGKWVEPVRISLTRQQHLKLKQILENKPD